MCSGGFEANRVDEIVEGLDDPLVELVKLREPLVLKFGERYVKRRC